MTKVNVVFLSIIPAYISFEMRASVFRRPQHILLRQRESRVGRFSVLQRDHPRYHSLPCFYMSNNQESDDIDMDSAESFKEGEELAKELYQFARERGIVGFTNPDYVNPSIEKNIATPSRQGDIRNKKKESFVSSERNDAEKESPKRRKKFTGRSGEAPREDDGKVLPSTVVSSSKGFFGDLSEEKGYFSKEGDFLEDPKTKMMRQEFNLVSIWGGERSIFVQVAFALLILGFYLYVGISGGITDGSERVVEEAIDFAEDFASQLSPDVTSADVRGSIWL